MNISSRWICVDNKLPEIGVEVLTVFKQSRKTIIFISYLNENNEWHIDNHAFNMADQQIPLIATYWKPLFITKY